MFRITVAVVCLISSIAASLQAQTPPPPATAAPAQTARAAQRPADYDRQADPSDYRYRPQSPRRTAPPPMDDSTWGFRNPGGVGRHAEYYPPGNQFQNSGAHPAAAQFDVGPAATRRDAQAVATSIGIQRTRAIQAHIDAYGRPFGGFGYGYGFGGFGFGFPMPY